MVWIKRTSPNKILGFQYTPETSREIWLRTIVALAAYVYEFEGSEIMSDATFDRLALEINPLIDTNRPDLDKWFREEFSPDTGQWIYKHPDFDRIAGRWRWIKSREGKLYIT